MHRLATGSIVLLLSFFAAAAGAQVHRCGDGRTYTDKPCDGAADVDLRGNILDAGPRFFPRQEPAPAIILPDTSRQPSAAPGGTIWERKDQRDSAHQGRTTGTLRP